MTKEAISLGRVRRLGGLSALAVRIRAPSGLNAAPARYPDGKGGDQLARGRVPELGSFVPLAVRIRAPSGLNATLTVS